MVLDDATLLQSIAALQTEEELRQVLNYLVLLQPESVQRALTYVKAQQKGRSGSGSAVSVRSTRSIISRGHMDTDDASVAPPSTSRNKSKKHKLQLVIVCSNAPSVTQALNQDYAMKLCKRQSIAPFIVLLEDPLQQGLVQQLLQLAGNSTESSSSTSTEVPLLFTRPRTHSHHQPALQDYNFVGNFATLEALERKGEFTAQSLLMPTTTTSTSPASAVVPDHLVGAHQPRRKLSSDNISLDIDTDLFEENVQEPVVTHKPLTQAALKAKAAAATSLQPRNSNGAVHNRTSSPQQTNRKAQAQASSPDHDYQAVPDFLVPLNQPTTVHSDDDLSIDSLKELFDPPRPELQPGQRPLVEAAKKAAAAMQSSQASGTQGTTMEAAVPSSTTTKRPSYGGVVLSSASKPRRPEVEPSIQTSVEVVELKPPATTTTTTTTSGSPKSSSSPHNHKHTKTPPTIVNANLPHDLVYQHPHVQDDAKHHIPTVVPEHATSTTVTTPAVQDLVYQQHTHASSITKSPTPIVEHATSDSVNTPAVQDMEYQHPSVDQTVVPEAIVEEEENSNDEEDQPVVVEQAAVPPPAVAKPEPEPVVPPAPAPAPPAAVKQVATVAPAPVPEPVVSAPPEQPEPTSKLQATTQPACYLVLSDDANELNIYFSELPIENAVGIWSSPDIVAFQQAQQLGNQAWIGQACSGILENSLNYYMGWTQFIKAAKSMDQASVQITGSGYPVDVYTYYNATSTQIQQGQNINADALDAVACLPPNSGFDHGNVKGKKWSKAAKKLGAVAVFKSLKEQPQPQQSVNASFDTMTSDEGEALMQEAAAEAAPAPAPAAAAVPAAPPAVLAPPKIAAAAEPQAPPQPHQAPAQPVAPASTSTSSTTILASPLDAPPGPACYLIYEPDSSGRLVLHYSKTPLEHAIGMWTPGAGKQISGFKFKQNLGRSVLIGSCSSGVQGRKNYCSGWCQFVRAARLQAGQVTLWDPTSKGLPVDIWLYNDTNKTNLDQSHKLVLGQATDVSTILAVACLPKNTDFYANLTVDLHKWMADGNSLGAVSKF